MTDTGLKFLPNDGGEAEGLNDSGIEMFRENPFAAAARETGQNSRDAVDVSSEPVRLTFDVLEIPQIEFPSIESYRKAADLCLKKAKDNSLEKETGFFKNAVTSLHSEKIKVLCISDSNTTGVRGPCVEGKPFHTLAKSDGMSVKQDISSGGSFGIGKNAIFAISDIHTVFVSTRYRDDDGVEQVLAMGKTQFISHTDENGKERRRKGYWGIKEGYMPVDNLKEVPDWMIRAEQGTSLFAACVRESHTDWRYEMAAEILINFFAAIQRQEMEFEIDHGTIKINRSTIEGLFRNSAVNKAVDELNARSIFDDAQKLHQCLIDTQTITEDIEIEDLGKVRMHTLLRDGLGYTVGVIRNGMYITDNLRYFGEQFKRFPLHKEFAVIIEPDGREESAWFKRLENPRHDSLSADQISDPDMRRIAKKAFKKLAKEIRTRIQGLAKSMPADSLELDELNEFFVTEGSRSEDDIGTETDPRSKEATPISRSKAKISSPGAKRHGKRGDPPGPGGSGTGTGTGTSTGAGPTKRPRGILLPVELQEERTLIPDAEGPSRRRIMFTSPVSAQIILEMDATGLSRNERLKIVSASNGNVDDNSVEVQCDEGKRCIVEVEFDSPYGGPIEISAHRYEQEDEEKVA